MKLTQRWSFAFLSGALALALGGGSAAFAQNADNLSVLEVLEQGGRESIEAEERLSLPVVGENGFWFPDIDMFDSRQLSQVHNLDDDGEKIQVGKGLQSINFHTLPYELAIVRVRGNGTRELAIVVDPTCPVCQQLEKELMKLDNVTVYTFIASILPQSKEVVSAIHCEPTNPTKAMAYEQFVGGGGIYIKDDSCRSDASDKILSTFTGDFAFMGKTTPSIAFPSHFVVNTLLDAKAIEDVLEIQGSTQE